MFKKCNYLLWALAAGLWCLAGNSHAAGEMSLTLDTMADSSNIQKYAGLKFLPDLKDSENGWASDNLKRNYKQIDNCKAYPKTGNCPNNQDKGGICQFDPTKYQYCFCSGYKYPYTAGNCHKTGTSSGRLVSGTQCREENGSLFFKDCGCTEDAYPYTDDASCGDAKKEIDTTEGCVIINTQRYLACKCKAEYDKDSSWTSKNGYSCTSCSDAKGTHYKCVAKACPAGETTTKTTCTGKQVWKGTENYSGETQCGKCSEAVNCGYFWNGNGAHTIPDSACSWDTYGHTATITVPSGKSYSQAWIRMWGDSSVSGDFTTTTLIPGLVISNGGAYKNPRTITYKGLVTVNGIIRLEPGITTVKFEKGVCGDFKCEIWSADSGSNAWHKVKGDIAQGTTVDGATCPKKNSNCPSTGCSRYFVNSDGNITIPDGQCGWDAYGHTANITTGTPKSDGTYENAWIRMWGDSTVTNAFKTKELKSGIVVSNGGYYDDKRTYTYKGKVTVNGVIKTDPSVTTSVFQGGIEGDYTCESWTGTGGNNMKKVADIQPGQPGCPCSQSKYKYDSSNCSGTPSGESCGGKYTACEAASNAQKCLDEGYRLKEDWPKPTASNETIVPSSMLANFMKKVFSMKPALAAVTTPDLAQGCPASMKRSCQQNCTSSCQAYYCCGLDAEYNVTEPVGPITGGVTEDLTINTDRADLYTFTVTATCPYDSNYVKGRWELNAAISGDLVSSCNGTKLTCVNNTYCCPTSTGITSCSQINSGTGQKCLMKSESSNEICNGTDLVCNGASYCCSSDTASCSNMSSCSLK